jgi:hypothetical protein
VYRQTYCGLRLHPCGTRAHALLHYSTQFMSGSTCTAVCMQAVVTDSSIQPHRACARSHLCADAGRIHTCSSAADNYQLLTAVLQCTHTACARTTSSGIVPVTDLNNHILQQLWKILAIEYFAYSLMCCTTAMHSLFHCTTIMYMYAAVIVRCVYLAGLA